MNGAQLALEVRHAMKAAQFSRFGGPEVLEIVDLPDPHPGPGQVRIAVHAAGINATEWKLRTGQLSFGAGLPQTTGRDVAGVVDEIGAGVTDVAAGDRVFGVSDDGAGAAELALLTYRAPIPPSLGFVDAAGLPVALETATRSLDALGVGRGISLLINGAAGGIGSTAVQLAVARGARVIGTASTANHDYLRILGAEPVAYGAGMAERVRALAPDGVDAALDVAGSGVLPELIDLAGGAPNVVTLADIDGAKRHEVRFSNGFQGHAFHALAEIGPLIEAAPSGIPTGRRPSASATTRTFTRGKRPCSGAARRRARCARSTRASWPSPTRARST
jgi:NADPH:quinone reductase-like Zn-dependent oxidoreductase